MRKILIIMIGWLLIFSVLATFRWLDNKLKPVTIEKPIKIVETKIVKEYIEIPVDNGRTIVYEKTPIKQMIIQKITLNNIDVLEKNHQPEDLIRAIKNHLQETKDDFYMLTFQDSPNWGYI